MQALIGHPPRPQEEQAEQVAVAGQAQTEEADAQETVAGVLVVAGSCTR